MAKKSGLLSSLILITVILSGCIVSKTPNTNNVIIPLGGQVEFSVVVYPCNATYAWSLDGVPLSNTQSSYLYTAQAGDHVLIVEATHNLGTDIQTWNISTKAPITFNKIYGGSENDWAYAVKQTSDGGYILAGSTHSYGAGIEDVWLVKTDMNGNMVWDKTFGGSNVDVVASVQQTSDGGYILAGWTVSFGTGGDAWLLKTDGDGNEVWNHTFGKENTPDLVMDVQQTRDGEYVLVGSTDLGGGIYDAWLIKTDEDGNKIWDYTFGENGNDQAKAVQQTSDGGYIIAGSFGSPVNGYEDFWLIKTDENGIMAWDTTFGGSSGDIAYAVQQTIDGGYIIAGSTVSFGAGHADFWLVKTDENGNMLWDRTYGGSDQDYAYGMRQTSDGGYIIAGYTFSFGAGHSDAWLIKTDVNGVALWDKTFGGSEWDYVYDIQQTSDGGYILVGSTGSFGAANDDVWLVKTDADGNAPASPTP